MIFIRPSQQPGDKGMTGHLQLLVSHPSLPESAAASRLLGIYPQQGEGLFMQRVKIPGGAIETAAWRGLAALAQRYTPGYPLHLTTRQDVELHGIRGEDLPAIERGICGAGMSSVGACGDTLRNVTVCPENGFRRGAWDVAPLAAALARHLEGFPGIRELPRKFKVSVSGCRDLCARPWINDVGLAANPDGTFRAVAGASLGGRPLVGVLLYESLAPHEVLPLTMAVLRLFHAEGDREHRARARLRHVRERFGDEAFRARVDDLFREELEQPASAPPLERVARETPLRARLALPLGDIDPAAALRVADAVESAGGTLRLGLQHDLLLFGDAPIVLDESLGALVGGPSIVACPGSTWCARALAASRDAAERVRDSLPRSCDLTIAIAGCPNNCSQAAVADIGLVGRVKRVGDGRAEAYRLLAGGGNGRTPALGQELHSAIPADEVGEAVSLVVREFHVAASLFDAGTRAEGLSFAEFVGRRRQWLIALLEQRNRREKLAPQC
jgi:sulfite reductase beta subunit-like hemoprotein